MGQRHWKIGDPCFIADVRIAEDRMLFRVMPAKIVHLAGENGKFALGRSVNPVPKSEFNYREPFTEGQPFSSRWSAYVYVWWRMRKNGISILMPIRFEGEMPQIKNLPPDLPVCGQIVYVLDPSACEILEVQIGYLRYEYETLAVGYDPSLGNAEATNIRIQEWWSTRVIAEIYARQNYGGKWNFVSKDELAARTNAIIKQIWSDAMQRISRPEFTV